MKECESPAHSQFYSLLESKRIRFSSPGVDGSVGFAVRVWESLDRKWVEVDSQKWQEQYKFQKIQSIKDYWRPIRHVYQIYSSRHHIYGSLNRKSSQNLNVSQHN